MTLFIIKELRDLKLLVCFSMLLKCFRLKIYLTVGEAAPNPLETCCPGEGDVEVSGEVNSLRGKGEEEVKNSGRGDIWNVNK